MTLDSVSFWNRWSDKEYKCDYEIISVNVLFISARWLREMTLSCQIYHKQHDEWINKYDSVLCNLQIELMNWNWWTWFHDKMTATD